MQNKASHAFLLDCMVYTTLRPYAQQSATRIDDDDGLYSGLYNIIVHFLSQSVGYLNYIVSMCVHGVSMVSLHFLSVIQFSFKFLTLLIIIILGCSVFDLLNIHLFHDASNLVSIELVSIKNNML